MPPVNASRSAAPCHCPSDIWKVHFVRLNNNRNTAFLAAPQLDDAERVPSQKVQDLAEAVVSLTLQVNWAVFQFVVKV